MNATRALIAGLLLVAAGCAGASAEQRPDAPPPRSDEPVTIGIVELQRIIDESAQGRHARERLAALFQTRQAELQEREQQVRERQQTLAGQPDDDGRRERLQALESDMRSLQADFEAYQRELVTRQQQLMTSLLGNIRTVARELSAEREMIIVLDRQSVVGEGVRFQDLTDAMLRRYDETFPVESGVREAAPDDGGDDRAAEPPSLGPDLLSPQG